MNSADKKDDSTSLNNNWALVSMYICFVFLTSYFVVNTFIVILISSFHENTNKKFGFHDISHKSMTWIKIMTRLSEVTLK